MNIGLCFDLWKDLDFDVRGSWNRVGQPAADSAGIEPDKDDFRFDLGLSWSF